MNGIKSTDKMFGWGRPGGRIYQKAYVEFFCSPEDYALFKEKISHEQYKNISYHAVNVKGEESFKVSERGEHTVSVFCFGKTLLCPLRRLFHFFHLI